MINTSADKVHPMFHILRSFVVQCARAFNLEKCTDLVLFWSHTQIDEKTIGSVIMMRMVPIWYNFKMCTDL